jgi:integrase
LAQIRSSVLESPSARLRLAKSGEPRWVRIAKGLALGYRRLGPNTAGPWVIRSTVGGKHWKKGFGTADDFEAANEANGIFDFWTAVRKAREVARGGGDADSTAIVTVQGALDAYQRDLKARGKNGYNARHGGLHLPAPLLGRPVGLLTTRELADYRDSLLAIPLSASSVNRTMCPLRAALELAAKRDRRIQNCDTWRIGLAKIPNARRSRNHQVLSDDQVRAVVAAAYEDSHEFGVLVEVAATTGSRYSQIARIEVRDLQVDNCRVMVPTSSKGRGEKKYDRRPVPITPTLAAKLQRGAEGRSADERLLTKPAGSARAAWGHKHQSKPFRRVAKRLGLKDTTNGRWITLGALRHSSITRMLLRNVPIRVVADMADTSVEEIEATYSRYIAHHSDAVFRAALIDLDAGPVVVPLRRAAG